MQQDGNRTAWIVVASLGGAGLFVVIMAIAAAVALWFAARAPEEEAPAVAEAAEAETEDAAPARPLDAEELQELVDRTPRAPPGGLVAQARLDAVAEPRPARFDAQLLAPPAPLQDHPEERPPLRHVADGLCLGDPSLRARLLDALGRATPEDPANVFHEDGYGLALHDCDRDEAGRWAATSAKVASAAAARGWLWALAAQLPSDGSIALFDAAPPEAVLELHAALFALDRRGPWHPALAVELGRRLADADPEAPLDADAIEAAVTVLAAQGSPEAARALIDARAGVAAALLPAFDRGLAAATDERLVALAAAACLAAGEGACAEQASFRRRLGLEPSDPETLAAAVLEGELSPALLLARRPEQRPALIAALRGCLADEAPAAECLGWLSLVDWGAARDSLQALRLAPGFSGEAALPELRELTTALRRFPTEQALEAHLDAALGPPGPAPVDPALLDGLLPGGVRHRLAARGHVLLFDPDRGVAPADHDTLVRHLLARGGVPYERFALDQRGPPRPTDDAARCELVAWEGGERLALPLLCVGAEVNGLATIGVANALLARAGRAARVVDLDPEQLPGAWLVGAEAGLRALHDERLLELPLGEPAPATE